MESDASGKEAAQSNAPKLDLGFKEGQTIKVNLNLGVNVSCNSIFLNWTNYYFLCRKRALQSLDQRVTVA